MPRSIYEALQTIPDPRNPSGKRYPLASIRAIVVAATLAGRTSLRAIARWAKGLSPEQLNALGITRGRAPGQTTMHNLLCVLPAKDVEKVLGQWVADATVTDLAGENSCQSEIFVKIRYGSKKKTLAVPLMQLAPADELDDDQTRQAIEDWRYWADRGYQF